MSGLTDDESEIISAPLESMVLSGRTSIPAAEVGAALVTAFEQVLTEREEKHERVRGERDWLIREIVTLTADLGWATDGTVYSARHLLGGYIDTLTPKSGLCSRRCVPGNPDPGCPSHGSGSRINV